MVGKTYGKGSGRVLKGTGGARLAAPRGFLEEQDDVLDGTAELGSDVCGRRVDGEARVDEERGVLGNGGAADADAATQEQAPVRDGKGCIDIGILISLVQLCRVQHARHVVEAASKRSHKIRRQLKSKHQSAHRTPQLHFNFKARPSQCLQTTEEGGEGGGSSGE